jgi:hypothetical protein
MRILLVLLCAGLLVLLLAVRRPCTGPAAFIGGMEVSGCSGAQDDGPDITNHILNGGI